MAELGPYRIIRRLGSGATAEVFLVEEKATGSKLALKRSLTPRANAPLLEEARAMAAVQHVSIPTVFAHGVLDGAAYMARAFIEGTLLEQVIDALVARPAQALPLEVIATVLSDVLDALHAVHSSLDVAHGDVAPANIIVTPQGRAMVIDLGMVDATAAEAGDLPGTFGYQAPETLDDVPTSRASDQFSIGVMAWELLCGKHLFLHDTAMGTLNALSTFQVVFPSSLRREVPHSLEAVVMRLLSLSPTHRYPSCAAARDALMAAMRQATRDDVAQAIGRLQ